MTSSTRPMTSSSWVTGGSLGTRDVDRHMQHSVLTSASHASINKLAFTSPTVKVGPADVRDELMDEIVNKPLVFHRTNFKSQSAPPSGRITSSALKSAGTRTTRWVVAPKRARTSFHRRRRGAKSWEKNPEPFMTVQVTGRDLWVVSNSTPTSYFTDKRDDGLRETSGMNGTRVSKWEDTAESVPKPEQISPPRHERLLGAPAQFAPSIQWLRYDPSSPQRKHPVLTPFKDGRYYNVESAQSKKVSQHLDASPGVRIARNGAVLAHSMKLETLDDSEPESQKESESEGSDIDVASLIPAKLAAKIRKHYVTPENETEEEDDDGQEEGEGNDDNERQEENADLQNADEKEEESDTELLENGVGSPQKLQKDDHENDSGHDSEEASELSSMSGDDVKGAVETKEYQDLKAKGTLLTKDSLALLTKLAVNDPSNPIVDVSAGSATSFGESLESNELNDLLEQNGISVDSPRIANGHTEQDDVWGILENATSNFWITKSKQQKLAILKRLRRQRKSEQIASARESLKSAKIKDECNEVILPLCWEDEINNANTKIVHVSSGVHTRTQQSPNTSLPLVFHKAFRYDMLPAAAVNSPLKPATPIAKHRPRSATSKSAKEMTFGFGPNRGFMAPVSTPRSNRSIRTNSASASSSTSAASACGHSPPHSIANETEIIRRSIDLADLLHVTPDSFPAKTQQVTTRAHTVKKERVTIVHDNVSGDGIQSARKVATQSMKKRGEDANSNDPKTASAPGNRIASGLIEKKQRVPAPVGTLNLTGIDTDMTTNDTITFSSQRPSDVRSTSFITPHNSPKTPMIHHSVVLAPKTSARGQYPDSIRLGVEADEDVVRNGYWAHDEPLSSKPITATSHDHLGSTARTPLSARARGGIHSVLLTQNRLKSGSSRGVPAHHSVMGPRPMKALPNLQPTKSNGVADLPLSTITMQLSAHALHNGLSPKTADFIQITQSLHISDRSPAQGDNPAVTGNKMYDSYMHELAAHGGAGAVEERNDPRGIVGRGLGGTSGKSSGFSLHRSVKKNFSSYRQSQQNPNLSPYTPQVGRRSGLTMVPHDNSQKVGPFGLGVKGDQVRLNIDKNIHNIYRDLGLLKTNGVSSKVDQHDESPGRSRVSSAGSRANVKEESIKSIPTASERSVTNTLQQTPKQAPPEESQTLPEVKTKRPSSSNPSIIVQDSGTQWSGRSVKFDDSRSLESQPGQQNVNGHPVSATSPGEVQAGTTEGYHPRIKFRGVSPGGSTSPELTTERTDFTDNIHESHPPTSERSLARAISRSSDAISATDSSLSLGWQPPSAVPRTASEILLDRLAEMGNREDSSDATEEEVEEAEDTNVKGVTRVTVNIPVKTEAIS